MRKGLVFFAVAAMIVAVVVPGFAQVPMQKVALDSTDWLKLINVTAELVTFKGRDALCVTDTAPANTGDEGRLVVLTRTGFQDGTIEVDLTGDTVPGAVEGARGFVGIAFRVTPDGSNFECIYLLQQRVCRRSSTPQPFGAVYFSPRLPLAAST